MSTKGVFLNFTLSDHIVLYCILSSWLLEGWIYVVGLYEGQFLLLARCQSIFSAFSWPSRLSLRHKQLLWPSDEYKQAVFSSCWIFVVMMLVLNVMYVLFATPLFTCGAITWHSTVIENFKSFHIHFGHFLGTGSYPRTSLVRLGQHKSW